MGPDVFVRGVVEYEIQRQADTPISELGRQLSKFLHGTQIWVDGTVITHRIAAIVFVVGHKENGHQMQVGDAEFFKIGDMLCQTSQIVTEKVHIQDDSHHVLGQISIRRGLPLLIKPVQILRSIQPI